jgi:hypothetical protein
MLRRILSACFPLYDRTLFFPFLWGLLFVELGKVSIVVKLNIFTLITFWQTRPEANFGFSLFVSRQMGQLGPLGQRFVPDWQHLPRQGAQNLEEISIRFGMLPSLLTLTILFKSFPLTKMSSQELISSVSVSSLV